MRKIYILNGKKIEFYIGKYDAYKQQIYSEDFISYLKQYDKEDMAIIPLSVLEKICEEIKEKNDENKRRNI